HDQGDAARGIGGLRLAGGRRQQGGQGQGGGRGRLGPCFHDLSPMLVVVGSLWCPASGPLWEPGAWPRLAKNGQAGNSTMASPVATVSPRWLVTCTSSVAQRLFSVLRVAVTVARGVMVSPGFTGAFQR